LMRFWLKFQPLLLRKLLDLNACKPLIKNSGLAV
jgi:hypothetical protein